MPGPKIPERKSLSLRAFTRAFHEQRTECDPSLPVYIHVRDGALDVYYHVEGVSISVHSPDSAALVIEAGEVSSVG
jgi:hypothetical protein